MTAYFIRRFLLIIPTFLGITIMVFIVTRFVPGGPIERIIAEAQQMQIKLIPQQHFAANDPHAGWVEKPNPTIPLLTARPCELRR
jgi:ABC-type microcin C transport system permease subunit YejB